MSDIYIQRLTAIVAGFRGLNATELSPTWKSELERETLDYWVEQIAAVTLSNVKELLAKPKPPRIVDLLALTPMDETSLPGVYLGTLCSKESGHHDHVYVGSATSPGFGLGGRVQKQHQDPAYRRKA